MNSDSAYTIGLDYGTNSVRCVVVRCADGGEIGSRIQAYPQGEEGVLLDPREPELARQHPQDYLTGLEQAVRNALSEARDADPDFSVEKVAGIGVDTTASTPIPVDGTGVPLAFQSRFARNLNAYAWLWKDHTATEEALRISEAARDAHPEYLSKCGGAYSSEWFWSKIWHCARVDPAASQAAHSWIELQDWIPAVLTGSQAQAIRGVCAAGHKGLYHPQWGGYPDAQFMASLDPELGRIRHSLEAASFATVDRPVGKLTDEWCEKLGLPAGIPIAAGGIDAHMGAIGSGIKPGTLVKILGTSTCDIMVSPLDAPLPDIPGLCGIVPGSVLPDCYGLEAGQSAVGDLFNWWVQRMQPHGGLTHGQLTDQAAQLRPGQSGLLALDWNNGNRTVLIDQRLSGLILGQSLQTGPEEIYRALIEATAFGARKIIDRLAQYGVRLDQVVNCGGIAEKSPLVMQIYADVLKRPMLIARSGQACALGSAIAAAVAAKVYPDMTSAQAAMTTVKAEQYQPRAEAVAVYDQLYDWYGVLHDAFGGVERSIDLGPVMKNLLALRERVRSG